MSGVKRERLTCKVNAEERAAIREAVANSGYPSFSAAVRDLPHLLAYSPTEVQANQLFETLTTAMVGVQAGRLRRWRRHSPAIWC